LNECNKVINSDFMSLEGALIGAVVGAFLAVFLTKIFNR
jgi:hypothetical protein